MGIRDMIRTAGFPAILAVTAPKNNEEEMALGNQLFTAPGLPLRGRWSDRKPKLMGHFHQYGTQCLIVDDAHDLSARNRVLGFSSHDKRKTRTSTSSRRWARIDSTWKVVGS